MTKRFTYQFLFLVLVALIFISCKHQKELIQKVTFWRQDKIPYGSWVAYENLKYTFPDATVIVNKNSPDRSRNLGYVFDNNFDVADTDQKIVYIIICRQANPDSIEIASLLNFAEQGNHIFISSFYLPKEFLDTLHLQRETTDNRYFQKDSLEVSVESLVSHKSFSYTYPGLAIDDYFTSVDTNTTDILGHNGKGQPNFVRYNYKNGGSIFVHLAPMALTNFFLLYKDNKTYYDHVFSYMPVNADIVKWDEYFRHDRQQSTNFSSLGFLMKHESFRWAILLASLVFLLIFVFESKRKQRNIPVIKSPANSSLDFISTVGRLYFQRRDNKNLALKMINHFQEYIRSKYNISTSDMNDDFIQRLAFKSGCPVQMIHNIVYHINTIHDFPTIEDHTLLEINQQFDEFFKKSNNGRSHL